MSLAPLNPAFNAIVLEMVSIHLPHGFDVTDDSSECDTLEKITAHHNATGRIRVWSGASDATIFGESSVNHAFRAWHDLCHVTLGAEFTRAGEMDAMTMQSDMVALRYGADSVETRLATLWLACEVKGQLDYAASHDGAFPDNQREFAMAWIRANSGEF